MCFSFILFYVTNYSYFVARYFVPFFCFPRLDFRDGIENIMKNIKVCVCSCFLVIITVFT